MSYCDENGCINRQRHLVGDAIDMKNNKQQTAVEWLIEQFWNNEGMLTSKKLEKAKEMEKEQHATTWDTAMDKLDARGGNIVRAYVDFDDYYNETFGADHIVDTNKKVKQ